MNTDTAATRVPGAWQPKRILIPVDGSDRSLWPIAYALRLAAPKPDAPSIVLLYVAEPVADLNVLRFRTHAQLGRLQRRQGDSTLAELADSLRARGLECETHYREGAFAAEVVDAVDLLGCDAIVVPAPRPRLQRLFERDLTHELLARGAPVPLVTVDAAGRRVDRR